MQIQLIHPCRFGFTRNELDEDIDLPANITKDTSTFVMIAFRSTLPFSIRLKKRQRFKFLVLLGVFVSKALGLPTCSVFWHVPLTFRFSCVMIGRNFGCRYYCSFARPSICMVAKRQTAGRCARLSFCDVAPQSWLQTSALTVCQMQAGWQGRLGTAWMTERKTLKKVKKYESLRLKDQKSAKKWWTVISMGMWLPQPCTVTNRIKQSWDGHKCKKFRMQISSGCHWVWCLGTSCQNCHDFDNDCHQLKRWRVLVIIVSHKKIGLLKFCSCCAQQLEI